MKRLFKPANEAAIHARQEIYPEPLSLTDINRLFNYHPFRVTTKQDVVAFFDTKGFEVVQILEPTPYCATIYLASPQRKNSLEIRETLREFWWLTPMIWYVSFIVNGYLYENGSQGEI